MSWRHLLLGVLGLTVSASPGFSAERPSTEVTILDQAPEIDGVISDGEWPGVAVLDRQFIQFQPEVGQPSPFRTTVRIAQTGSALYVAIEGYDPDPDRLAAAITRRDGSMDDDDSVAVMLDTFSDAPPTSFPPTRSPPSGTPALPTTAAPSTSYGIPSGAAPPHATMTVGSPSLRSHSRS